MQKEFNFEVKIHKTTDKKKLIKGETKNYDYGTVNIRRPELAPFIGKKAKVIVKVE